jgi:hypothetical protein
MQPDKLHIKPNVLSKATKFLQGYGPKYPDGKYMTVTQDYTNSKGSYALSNSQNESRAQKILEILGGAGYNPHALRVENNPFGGTLYRYETNIGDQKAIFKIIEKKGIMELVFEIDNRTWQPSRHYTKTSQEDVKTAFTALGIMKEMFFDVYNDQYESVRAIKFSGDWKEPNRVKLYDNFMRKIAMKIAGGDARLTRRFDRAKGAVEFFLYLPSPFERESMGYV